MGYRLPLVTSVAIFLLLLAGVLVVGFDAGLACSDWPLCNGHIIPPLEGKIIIEYSHRMLTTAVSFLVLANVCTGWRHRKENPLASKLAYLSFFLLAMVAILGGVNVLSKLPPGFTTMDTSFAMLLLLNYITLTGVTLAQHCKKKNKFYENKNLCLLYKPALVATVAVYVQYVLGAFIKHSKAGQVWVNGKVTFLNELISSPAIAQALLFIHYAATVFVSGFVIVLVFHAVNKKVLQWQAIVLVSSLIVQILAGFMALATNLSLVSDLLHLGSAALILAFCVFITIQAKIGANLTGKVEEKRLQSLC